jgi:hypothetical protein
MQTDELAARVRTAQIITAAIILGAAAFLVVAFVVRAQSSDPAPDRTPLSWVALVAALVMAVAYYFVIDAVAAGQRRRIAQSGGNDPKGWYAAYQTTLVAGLAVLEGAAFLLIVAYLVEGSWEKNWVPLVAAAGFIAFMATLFPSRPGIERWIAEQREKLRAEQSGRR